MKQDSLGIIGIGSMAGAMLDGILAEEVLSPENIYVTNKNNDDRLKFLNEKYHVNATRDYSQITSNCKNLLIAVKPKDVAKLVESLKDLVTTDHVIISVAAGITTQYLEAGFDKEISVIRVMPNTSSRVRESATGVALGRYVKNEDIDFAKKILSSIGKVVIVKEELIDAVTGLSGSGPAYVYLMMEAMIQAGVKQGLPRTLAEELTFQTVYGAAKMALNTNESPEQLIQQIATPGGTTRAGLQALERANITGAFIDAVSSATKRSKEMMAEDSVKFY